MFNFGFLAFFAFSNFFEHFLRFRILKKSVLIFEIFFLYDLWNFFENVPRFWLKTRYNFLKFSFFLIFENFDFLKTFPVFDFQRNRFVFWIFRFLFFWFFENFLRFRILKKSVVIFEIIFLYNLWNFLENVRFWLKKFGLIFWNFCFFYGFDCFWF